MKTNLITAFSLVSAAMVVATPAAASTQDDIKLCRAALSAQETLNMDEYRLRYKSSKGNRTKNISMVALTNGSGTSYDVACVVSRGKVVSVAATPK